jgi:hypothetical protein
MSDYATSLRQQHLEDITFQLQDLEQKGNYSFKQLYLKKDWYKSEVDTVHLINIFDKNTTSYQSASVSAIERGCLYDIMPPFTPKKGLLLISYLISEAQTALLEQRTTTNDSAQTTSETVLRQNLIRMLDNLTKKKKDIPSKNTDLVKLLHSEVVRHINNEKEGDCKPLIDKKSLNKNEITAVRNILEDFNLDFSLRKKMALQRLDLTLQSFLWSNKAQGQESSIIATIRPLVAQLHALPFVVTEDLIYNADDSLTRTQYAAVGSGGSGRVAVKDVLIGNVPDRGGRVEDVRPHDLMPTWTKRGTTGGGGSRGGKGGSRGGKGYSRGGGGGGGGGSGGKAGKYKGKNQSKTKKIRTTKKKN